MTLQLLSKHLIPFDFAGVLQINVVFLADAELHVNNPLKSVLYFLHDLQVILPFDAVRQLACKLL